MHRHRRLSRVAGALAATGALAASAGLAHAAALEQSVPSTIRLLYQEGRYIEFGVQYTDPDQSGEGATIPAGVLAPIPVPLEGNTGDVFEHRWNFTGAYKADLNDRLSYGLFFDQPFCGRHPLRGRDVHHQRPRPRHSALRRQHGRPEDLPDHRRTGL